MKKKRLKGRIATLRPGQGYGFILDDSGNERFFHATAVEFVTFDTLRPNDLVSFVPMQTSKGPRAAEVRKEEEEE